MRIRRIVLALGVAAMVVCLPSGFSGQDDSEEKTGGVKPASEVIASDAAVRAEWESGGVTLEAKPDTSRAGRGAWNIVVKNYRGDVVLKTVALEGVGQEPERRSAKAMTRAVALLQQRTSKPGAEVRLSFGSRVVVRARSHSSDAGRGE